MKIRSHLTHKRTKTKNLRRDGGGGGETKENYREGKQERKTIETIPVKLTKTIISNTTGRPEHSCCKVRNQNTHFMGFWKEPYPRTRSEVPKHKGHISCIQALLGKGNET